MRIAPILVAALVFTGSAPAAVSTLSFTRTVVKSHYLDRGAPGPSVGDQRLFTAELRDSASGELHGWDRGFCTAVAVDAEQCRQSLTLASGQIDLQGSYSTSAPTLAVTAGSGAYRTAHGQARVTSTRLSVTVDTSGAPPRRPTLLLSQQTTEQTYLDRGTPGRGAGDETFFGARIRGDRAGRANGFCLTVTDGNGVVPNAPPYQAQCQQSYVLNDGTITLEGFFDETAYDAGTPQTLPVVGGTRAYDHAHGQATIRKTGTGTASITVQLDPPGTCTPLQRTYLEQGIQFYQVPDDDNPAARGAGDLLTSTAELLEPGTSSRRGTTHAFFLTTEDNAGAAPFIAQASQTNRIDGGTIEFGGMFNQTDFEAFVPAVFPINGGTGVFAEAHGTATVRQVVFPATFEIQIDLICD